MKFLNKNAKLFIAIYVVLLAFVVLFACYFMTQYQNIHVAYAITDGKLMFEPTHTVYTGGPSNEYLFAFFSAGKTYGLSNYSSDTTSPLWSVMYDYHIEKDIAGFTPNILENKMLPDYFFSNAILEGTNVTYAQYVYNFAKSMNTFNDSLITYSLVCIVLVCLLFLFGNHSRNIYYGSNLVVGILSPLAVIGYTVVMMIKNFQLQTMFNEHNDLLRIVSVLVNPNLTINEAKSYMAEGGYEKIMEASSNITGSTFYISTVIFALVCIVSVLIMVYTIYRYKSTAKRRQEVIERAVQNND